VARYELSIEVLDAAFSASSWKSSYGDVLTTTAVEHGAVEWQWIERSWGVVFEVAFAREREADRWRELPVVIAAFDAVPDPVNGLVYHRGWGGTSGSGEPRHNRPLVGAGGAEVELPDDDADLLEAVAARLVEDRGHLRTRTAASF
jgi:hypothetical protein